MKALAYIRVSTEEQAEKGVSLDNQKDRINAYCKYKGFDLIEMIEDAGVSGGTNRGRVGFNKLLSRVEHNGVDVIILYSLERLSRDMLTLLALERLLNECDVEIHTIDGVVDTSKPEGFMNFAMKAFLGEMERRQIKYRTKKALEHKKNNGEVVGSVPFGYRRKDKDLIPDLKEQPIIRTVNRLYRKKTPLADIVRNLNKRGKRTRSGQLWTPTQIKRIITG